MNLTELVERSRAGDREAFGVVYRQAWPAVLAFVRARVSTWDDAREVGQEVFLQAWRDLPGLRKPEAFWGWLRAIASHEVQKRGRVRRTVGNPDPELADPGAPDPGKATERAEFDRALDRALADLRGDAREAAYLFLGAGLSYREVGERLGMNYDQAKGVVARAVARIATDLKDFLEPEDTP